MDEYIWVWKFPATSKKILPEYIIIKLNKSSPLKHLINILLIYNLV